MATPEPPEISTLLASPTADRAEATKSLTQKVASLTHAGWKASEIGEALGLTAGYVNRILDREETVAYLERLRRSQEAHAILLKDTLRVRAFEVLEGLLDLFADASTPPATRATIGFGLLDREGTLSPRTEVKHTGAVKVVSDDALDRVITAMESRGEPSRS